MSPNITLALVHLGETSPRHLWVNFQRLQRDFKNLDIVLIADSERILVFAQSLGLTTYQYKETKEDSDFFSTYPGKQDYHFRSGFWRHSLQRIFALIQFHNLLGDTPLIHIENDIYITPDFPFEKFSDFTKIAWSRYSETHDAASILFLPTTSESQNLNLWIKNIGHELDEMNDMTILNVIARSHEEVALLPIAESANSELLNQNIIIGDDAIEITKYYNYFDGYFDPAAIGMWTCGVDPRNNLGFVKRFIPLPESYIDPEKVGLQVKNGNVKDRNLNSIFNLHVHSKSLKILGVRSPNYLEKIANSKYNFMFSAKALLAIVLDYKKRGKILHLFYNLPPFTLLRKSSAFIALKDFLFK